MRCRRCRWRGAELEFRAPRAARRGRHPLRVRHLCGLFRPPQQWGMGFDERCRRGHERARGRHGRGRGRAASVLRAADRTPRRGQGGHRRRYPGGLRRGQGRGFRGQGAAKDHRAAQEGPAGAARGGRTARAVYGGAGRSPLSPAARAAPPRSDRRGTGRSPYGRHRCRASPVPGARSRACHCRASLACRSPRRDRAPCRRPWS